MIVWVTMVIFSFELDFMEFSTTQPQSQDISNIHEQAVYFSAIAAAFLLLFLKIFFLTLFYLQNSLRDY